MEIFSSTVVLLGLATGILAFASYLVSCIVGSQDPNEPPQASTTIPFIGHVIGIMRNKFDYYVQLNASKITEYDIFTMTIPGQKMYVVTSPELIQVVQKKSKVLAFPPIEARVASKVCGVSAEAFDIILKNVNGDEGDWGLSMDSFAAMRGALGPGQGLDAMNRVMVANIAKFLDGIEPVPGERKTIQLSKWVQHSVTLATTNSVYGPENPFLGEGVAAAFWVYAADLMPIMMDMLPSIVARKGIAARTKVATAFEHYFETGGHERGSELAKKRYEACSKNGLAVYDTARFEIGDVIAMLANTVPAAFWLLVFIYSDPSLVEDLRRDIEPTIVMEVNPSGLTRSLDITSLKQNCPLLTSAFQEVLRIRGVGTSVREVMEDTILQDRWLLKKGSMIQMPSRVLHIDHNIWGTDAEKFEPRRFMKDAAPKTKNGKRPNPSAFRAFGGGTTLCPGRHFATTELLALVSMFIVRYDMAPVKGKWELPSTKNTNIAAIIMEPDSDIEVSITTRKGFREGKWSFGLRDSEKFVALVAEDQIEP